MGDLFSLFEQQFSKHKQVVTRAIEVDSTWIVMSATRTNNDVSVGLTDAGMQKPFLITTCPVSRQSMMHAEIYDVDESSAGPNDRLTLRVLLSSLCA